MRPTAARIALGALLLALSACHGGESPPASHDTVVVTHSIPGTVRATAGGAGITDALTFNTSDGRAAKDLEILTDLTRLPAGWTASPQVFSCASVATGSGCLLDLTFAPRAGTSGTLPLSFSYINDAGQAQSGSVSIPYAATTHDNVVGTASPSGQVAVVVGGSQAVTVTFDTDDGYVATHLAVTSNLSALPPGWSSSSGSFACSSVSSGNSCQLALTYRPTQSDSGTLTLGYSFIDDAGSARTGAVNISYSATTNDNAVATVTPTGTIPAAVGASVPVTASFTTDDGNTATSLSISGSALASMPGGWSSPGSPFYCATFASGNGCQLTLTYAPTAAASGTLTLPYSYVDNAGASKTGTLSIPYAAVALRAYVSDEGAGTVDVCDIGANGSLSGCTPTGSGFTEPLSVVFNGSDAYVSDYGGSIFLCQVASDGTFSGCASAASGFQYPGALVIAGTSLYAPNDNTYDGPEYCAIGAAGALSGCAATGAVSSINQASGVAFFGATAYVSTGGDQNLPGLLQCTVAADGDIPNSGCADANTGLTSVDAVTVHQSRLYAVRGSAVTICAIGSGGSLSGCATSTPFAVSGTDVSTLYRGPIAISGGYAYIAYDVSNPMTMANQSGVAVCALAADGSLSNCSDSGLSFSNAMGVAVH